jgi:hypothetical protein
MFDCSLAVLANLGKATLFFALHATMMKRRNRSKVRLSRKKKMELRCCLHISRFKEDKYGKAKEA